MSLRSCLQVRKELGVAVTLGRMIDGEEISSLRPTRCHGASCFRMQARADRWHAGRRVPRNQERQWLPPGSGGLAAARHHQSTATQAGTGQEQERNGVGTGVRQRRGTTGRRLRG